jgi:transposase
MSDDEVDAMHQARHEDRAYRRIELITGGRRRRSWTAEEKDEILAASAEPHANISEVARRFGVNRGLLGVWRRQAGLVAAPLPSGRSVEDVFVPITVMQGKAVANEAAGGGDGPVQPCATDRIEVEFDGVRLVVRGAVELALAAAVVAALRGRR